MILKKSWGQGGPGPLGHPLDPLLLTMALTEARGHSVCAHHLEQEAEAQNCTGWFEAFIRWKKSFRTSKVWTIFITDRFLMLLAESPVWELVHALLFKVSTNCFDIPPSWVWTYPLKPMLMSQSLIVLCRRVAECKNAKLWNHSDVFKKQISQDSNTCFKGFTTLSGSKGCPAAHKWSEKQFLIGFLSCLLHPVYMHKNGVAQPYHLLASGGSSLMKSSEVMEMEC